MYKPLVAAITGVSFGLFLGVLGYKMNSSCPRRAAMQSSATATEMHPCRMRQAVTQHPPVVIEVATSTEDMTTDDILSAAQTAYVNGDYKESIRIAMDVQASSPVRAWRIMGSAACHTGDQMLVDRAYRRLDAPGRQYLVYVCQRSGMTVNIESEPRHRRHRR